MEQLSQQSIWIAISLECNLFAQIMVLVVLLVISQTNRRKKKLRARRWTLHRLSLNVCIHTKTKTRRKKRNPLGVRSRFFIFRTCESAFPTPFFEVVRHKKFVCPSLCHTSFSSRFLFQFFSRSNHSFFFFVETNLKQIFLTALFILSRTFAQSY